MNGIYDEIRIALHAIWTPPLARAGGRLGHLPARLAGRRRRSRTATNRRRASSSRCSRSCPTQGRRSPRSSSRRTSIRVRQTLTSAVNLRKGRARHRSGQHGVERPRRRRPRRRARARRSRSSASRTICSRSPPRAASPEAGARTIVQKLIDIFVEENLAGDRDETTQSLHFLDAQLAQRQKQLAGGRGEARRVPEPLSRLAARHGLDQRPHRRRAHRRWRRSTAISPPRSRASLRSHGQMAGTPRRSPVRAAVPARRPGARAAAWRSRARSPMRAPAAIPTAHPDMIALQEPARRAAAAARGEPTDRRRRREARPTRSTCRSGRCRPTSRRRSPRSGCARRSSRATSTSSTPSSRAIPRSPPSRAQIDRDYAGAQGPSMTSCSRPRGDRAARTGADADRLSQVQRDRPADAGRACRARPTARCC